jgi:membrane fusion protein (multidrug efflux system)
MRSVVAVVVVLLLAAAAGGAYWRLVAVPQQQAAAGARGGPPPGFAVPVEVAPARVGPASRSVQAVGSLRSNESVIVRPEIPGRIAQFGFAEGQKVKQGQMLVQLDRSVLRAELAQAQASLALAKANYERADDLKQRGAGTQKAFDEALARLRADEALVALVTARLDKATIAAPFDGVMGLRRASVGDFVNMGAEIVNLEAIDPIKVDFRVPEQFVAAVKPGQRIQLGVDAFPERGFEGEVMAVDPLVDQAGRAVVIRAKAPNPDLSLRPGLFARVSLALAERPDAVFVPEQALIPVGEAHFVFRVVDGKAVYTRVKLGQRRKGEVEIADGVGPGDQVVTAGAMKIRDGMPVMALPPAAAKPQG